MFGLSKRLTALRSLMRPAALAGGLLVAALPAVVAADEAITVDLAEFTVTPTQSAVAAGQIDLTVNNVGQFPHELVIVRTNLAADALPTDGDGRVDESGLDIAGRVDQFVAGDGAQELSVDLAAGSYVLYCNVGPHYSRGMTIGFDVSAAAAPAADPVPAAAGSLGLASDSTTSVFLLVAVSLFTVTLLAGGRALVGRK